MLTRYIVHGTDAKGLATQKIIEAETSAEAEAKAAKIGLAVAGSEVDPTSVGGGGSAPRSAAGLPSAFPDDTPTSRRLGPENEIWKGTPSQWVNAWWFAACVGVAVLSVAVGIFFPPGYFIAAVLVVLGPWAAWRFLDTKFKAFTLTSQRLRIERGVLAKTVDEVELYRIKDTQLNQTFTDRVLNIGTIEVLSSDETNPKLYLPKVPGPRQVREQLRGSVERVRLARGVRELDVAWEHTGNP